MCAILTGLWPMCARLTGLRQMCARLIGLELMCASRQTDGAGTDVCQSQEWRGWNWCVRDCQTDGAGTLMCARLPDWRGWSWCVPVARLMGLQLMCARLTGLELMCARLTGQGLMRARLPDSGHITLLKINKNLRLLYGSRRGHIKQAIRASTLAWHTRKWAVQSFI